MTHTLAPWTYVPTYSSTDDRHVIHQVLSRDADGSEFIICEARTAGNAAFIAAAANLHSPMVSLLKVLRDNPGETLADHPDRLAIVEEVLRQAKAI